jgi:hypothetical protein
VSPAAVGPAPDDEAPRSRRAAPGTPRFSGQWSFRANTRGAIRRRLARLADAARP